MGAHSVKYTGMDVIKMRPSGRGNFIRDHEWIVVLILALLASASVCWCVFTFLQPDGRIGVTLDDGGRVARLRVQPCTVEELLTQTGTALAASDIVTPASDTPLQDGDAVHITRAFPVAVASGGTVRVLHMAEGTVGEALTQAQVHYDVDDELSHLAFADVTAGMRITHTSVEEKYTSTNKTLYFQDKTVKDDSWYTEKKEVEQDGKNGSKQVTQRITTKNGVEVSREVVDQVVLEPAVDRITRVGTKIHYQTHYQGETRLYKPAPRAGEDGWTKMEVYRVTAYCTGSRTATGTRPKLGCIAVNPKLIPYGSQIYIKGYGYGTAQDTGAFRNYASPKNNAIDLWFNTESEARRFGSKYNVTILVKLK